MNDGLADPVVQLCIGQFVHSEGMFFIGTLLDEAVTLNPNRGMSLQKLANIKLGGVDFGDK